MPGIKIQHVVSCSSEDTLHKVNNLLNAESFRKWKCAQPGEKQASVILQLEKSSIIHSIDIGNESSAFIEVLVGHSTSDNPEDYQVILVTSSFMNPLESKNGTNANRVRMFGPDKLCKTVLDKRWDRVKVVCTQPFNKHISYGISFIKLHSTPDEPDAASPTSPKMLGMFALKEETPSTKIAAGSFFKDRNKAEEQTPLKGAAAIRAASYQVKAESSATPSPRKPASETPKQKAPSRPSPSAASTSATPKQSEQKQPTKRKLSEEREDKPSPQSSKPKVKKTRHEEEKKEAPKGKVSEIMKGVTFVMSGYQNPYRGELRDKAAKMGAKYEANWGPGCTHLICAFLNTPKYTEVHGKGKIVSKHWILDSYRKKCMQPWQRYKLSQDSGSSSSDEEGDSKEGMPPPPKRTGSSEAGGGNRDQIKQTQTKYKLSQDSGSSSSEDEEDLDSREETPPPPKKRTGSSEAAGGNRERMKQTQGGDKVKGGGQNAAKRSPKKERTTEAGTPKPKVGNTSTLHGLPGLKESNKKADQEGDDDDGDVTDVESIGDGDRTKDALSSDADTEDELLQAQEETNKQEADVFAESTDEEEEMDTNGDDVDWTRIPELPDFFLRKRFMFYGKFPPEDRRQLRRCVIAFGGKEENYMSDAVDYVITESQWDNNFDQALKDKNSLVFVSPRWIHVCSEKGELVSPTGYAIQKN